MATIDPTSALNAVVSCENAVQVIMALQTELSQFNIDLNSQMSQNKSSVDFELTSVQGDVKGLTSTVDKLKDDVKAEIVKTNGMMDKMKEEVIEACSAGGVIDMSIQQLVSPAFASLNNTINGSVTEIVAVKVRVKQIEDMTAANTGATSSQNVMNKSHKVLLEYHVINNLQIIASEKLKYKEWNDKLVNAVTQFRPYARSVLK